MADPIVYKAIPEEEHLIMATTKAISLKMKEPDRPVTLEYDGVSFPIRANTDPLEIMQQWREEKGNGAVELMRQRHGGGGVSRG